MGVVATIILKVISVFGPSIVLTFCAFRLHKVEVVWALSLFFAFVAAQVTLWIGFLLRLPATNFIMFPLYWVALAGIVFGIVAVVMTLVFFFINMVIIYAMAMN